MNKYTAVIILTIGLTTGAFSQTPTPTPPPPTPSPTMSPRWNCLLQSWNPETHIFYGPRDKIVDKLTAWCAKPTERRLMVQITQGDKLSSDVRLFERDDKGGAYSVTDWSTKAPAVLIYAIDRAIMENHGTNCIGEKLKKLLKDLGHGKPLPNITEPNSPADFFAPAVKDAHGDFIKTVVVFGC